MGQGGGAQNQEGQIAHLPGAMHLSFLLRDVRGSGFRHWVLRVPNITLLCGTQAGPPATM